MTTIQMRRFKEAKRNSARDFPSFKSFEFVNGLMCDMSGDDFPTRLSAWENEKLALDDSGTHFGYVFAGEAEVECRSGRFKISSGMYFSIPGDSEVGGVGRGIVMTRVGFNGLFQLGGPIESRGRLRYIDGCTDSLLIAPVKLGDPCLNLLHFPTHVNQTQHTHPSMRVGMVVRGVGKCITPEGDIPLVSGMVFVIPANRLHSFRTESEEMTVIAYHPDSDFGPTHENHPMINRTIVEGMSVSRLSSIHTKGNKD